MVKTGRGQFWLWVISRAVEVLVWVVWLAPKTYSNYFFKGARQAADLGLAEALVEYPAPTVWVAQLPYLISGANESAYFVTLLAMILALDGVFAFVLWRSFGWVASSAWTALVLASGSMVLMRLDVVSALLVAFGVLAVLRSRSVTGGSLLALATGVKLWPVVLAPLLLRGGRRGRWLAVGAYALVGAGLVSGTVAFGGVDRLFSPLTWQQDRGLHMESVAATPLIWLRLIDNRYQYFYSSHKAMEISGPRVGQMLTVADVAFVVGLVAIAVLFAFWLWRGAPLALVPGLAIFAVAVVLVTGKTLSPQYLLWLSALVPIWLGSGGGRPARVTFFGTLGAALLTTVFFPVCYGSIFGREWDAWLLTGVLATRNLLLCALTVYVGWWLVRQLRGDKDAVR